MGYFLLRARIVPYYGDSLFCSDDVMGVHQELEVVFANI
jgi:hypothetical protein